MGLSPIYAALLAGAVAFTAGFALDHKIMQGKIAESENQALRSKSAYIDRNLEQRQESAAREAESRRLADAALRKAQNAKQKPIPCPPSGDVLDALIPGLADELRGISEAGGKPASATVDRVPINPNPL